MSLFTKTPYDTFVVMDVLKMYKVVFYNNKAVSSEEVDRSNKVRIETDISGGRRVLISITIFASGEKESIVTAQGIADIPLKATG